MSFHRTGCGSQPLRQDLSYGQRTQDPNNKQQLLDIIMRDIEFWCSNLHMSIPTIMRMSEEELRDRMLTVNKLGLEDLKNDNKNEHEREHEHEQDETTLRIGRHYSRNCPEELSHTNCNRCQGTTGPKVRFADTRSRSAENRRNNDSPIINLGSISSTAVTDHSRSRAIKGFDCFCLNVEENGRLHCNLRCPAGRQNDKDKQQKSNRCSDNALNEVCWPLNSRRSEDSASLEDRMPTTEEQHWHEENMREYHRLLNELRSRQAEFESERDRQIEKRKCYEQQMRHLRLQSSPCKEKENTLPQQHQQYENLEEESENSDTDTDDDDDYDEESSSDRDTLSVRTEATFTIHEATSEHSGVSKGIRHQRRSLPSIMTCQLSQESYNSRKQAGATQSSDKRQSSSNTEKQGSQPRPYLTSADWCEQHQMNLRRMQDARTKDTRDGKSGGSGASGGGDTANSSGGAQKSKSGSKKRDEEDAVAKKSGSGKGEKSGGKSGKEEKASSKSKYKQQESSGSNGKIAKSKKGDEDGGKGKSKEKGKDKGKDKVKDKEKDKGKSKKGKEEEDSESSEDEYSDPCAVSCPQTCPPTCPQPCPQPCTTPCPAAPSPPPAEMYQPPPGWTYGQPTPMF